MIKKIRHTLNKETMLVKSEIKRDLMFQFQKEGNVHLGNQEFKFHFALIKAFGLKEKHRFFVLSERQMMEKMEPLEGFNSQSAILIPHLKQEADSKSLGFFDQT